MGDCLAPCPSCARHVRCAERSCPFCGQAIPERVAPEASSASPAGPLTRAALLFAGATALSACSSTASAPAYGPGPVDYDAAQDTSSEAAPEAGPGDATTFDGPVALYGPAPVDAGPGDAAPGDSGPLDGSEG